jgi:hypothetical protein
MKVINTNIRKHVKWNLAALLSVFLGFGTFAQQKERNIHIALIATPGIYWLSSTAPASNHGAKFGFGYGANIEFGLTETIYFITGLEVNAAGANYKSTDSVASMKSGRVFNTYTGNENIQYLKIPLFFKMKTKEIGMLKYFGQIGLGSGIAISNRMSWTNSATGTALASSGTNEKTADLNLIRESLLIGAGMEYNLSGSTSLVGSIMFDNGFTPVLPGNGITPSGNPNPVLYSKGITLTIGILF